MKSVVAIYAKHLLFLSLAAGMLSALLFIILPGAWFSPALPFLFVFYYACSLISFLILSRSLQIRFGRFVSVFMLATAAKLFLYIAVMIIYALINKKDAVSFLLNFFILYLVYTIFEVTQIIRLTKPPTSAEA